jgi:hypothetical protein
MARWMSDSWTKRSISTNYAKAYTNAGFPWFDFYDDTHTDLTASEVLAEVKSMAQMDALHGLVDKNDESLHVSDHQVVTYVSSSKPIGKG